MSENIHGIHVSCPDCNSSGVSNVTRYVWWVNQYGAKVRVFCHVCGTVVDKTKKRGFVELKRASWTATIWTKPEFEGDIPF